MTGFNLVAIQYTLFLGNTTVPPWLQSEKALRIWGVSSVWFPRGWTVQVLWLLRGGAGTTSEPLWLCPFAAMREENSAIVEVIMRRILGGRKSRRMIWNLAIQELQRADNVLQLKWRKNQNKDFPQQKAEQACTDEDILSIYTNMIRIANGSTDDGVLHSSVRSIALRSKTI